MVSLGSFRTWYQVQSVGLLILFLTCVACSRPQRADAGSDRTTLPIGIAAPQGSLDPGIQAVASLLSHESLVTISNDGRVGPNIVETWRQSADGLTWRLELREGLTFHDGTKVNSATVAEILRAALRDPSQLALAPSFQQIAAITEDGPKSIVLTLTRPSALLLSDLAFFSLTHGTGNRVAGTGPFVVESRDEKRIVMRRFERYREGAPAIARIELNAFPTVRNAWTAMMRGEVDFLYEVGADATEFVGGESSVQTFTFLRPYTLTLGFNLRHPILRSREVRQALNSAIDRHALVKAGFRGRARPAQDPVWPTHWASSQTAPRYSYNREAALLGFSAAGYGTLRQVNDQMPSRFQFKCLVYPPLERVALMIQKQLFEVGVDMAIEIAKTAEIVGRAARGDFDAFLIWQVSGRSLTFPYLFWHSPEPGRPGFLQSGFSAADAALDRVRYAKTDDEFRNAVAAFQQVIHNDPPAIFLAWEERVRAVNRTFQVPPQEPGRDIIFSLWRWRPADQRLARAQ
jgi:peptide/nickel transport system substrate-binding protein